MTYYRISESGAETLRKAVRQIVRMNLAEGGDRQSRSAGTWVQNSAEYGDWEGHAGGVAGSFAATYGTSLADWHPMGRQPRDVLAVDFAGEIRHGYGDLAAHVAVIGGWKMLVDARQVRPESNSQNPVLSAHFIGAIRDHRETAIGLRRVKDAASIVLSGGYKPQRNIGDPHSPALISCEECPLERDYGYGRFADHDLFASHNTVERIVHIADLALGRDGWEPTT